MSSNSLLFQLTFAMFAFVIPISVMGTPTSVDDSFEDTSSFSLNLEGQDSCDFDPLPPNVQLYYYTKDNPDGKLFEFENPPVEDFYESSETKILTHGFKGSIEVPEFKEVISEYMNFSKSINLLALNWSSYTNGKYRDAAKASVVVGQGLANLFCVLYKNYDIYPFQMHMIGHNLGAHLLAFAARDAPTKVGRITGLDPARLCFEDNCRGIFYQQLNSGDAKYVDVLHTDAGGLGVHYTHGISDFYANGGKMQPRCKSLHAITTFLDNCDSYSSYLYFAESIRRPTSFYGSFCETAFPNLNCNTSNGAYWGEHMGSLARGIYTFKTKSEAPFGEGKPKLAAFE